MKTIILFSTAVASALALQDAGATTDPSELTEDFLDARIEAEFPALSARNAAINLGTAEGAYDFVKNGIAHASYDGHVQGPDAVLRTRMANDIDRALLLASLLREFGQEAELVSATLPGDTKRHQPDGYQGERPAMANLSDLVSDYSSLPLLTAEDAERQRLKRQDAEVKAAFEQIYGMAFDLEPSETAIPRAPESINSYFVKTRAPGGAWEILSPSFDATPSIDKVQSVRAMPHQFQLVLSLEDGKGNSRPILQHQAELTKVIGYDLLLAWKPKDEKVTSPASLQVPLQHHVAQWEPSLQIGPNQIKGIPFALPTQPGSGIPVVRLHLTISGENGEKHFTRVLHDFGPGFDHHEMIALHRIGISAAAFPPAAVEPRILDELLDINLLKRYAAGWSEKPEVLSNERGFSVRTAHIINSMITNAIHTDPSLQHLEWNGPALYLETTKLRKKGSEIVSTTLLDMINQPFAPKAEAPIDLKARWGLGILATEGHLVRSKSVNQLILEGEGEVELVAPTSTEGLFENAEMVLAKASVPNAAWVVEFDGSLRGVITERSSIQGKGGISSDRATVAGSAYAALGSAALSAGGAGPLGPLVGGIAGYLNELAKAYRGAAAKMNWLAKTIQQGSPAEEDPSHDEYFQNLASNLIGGFAQGYATSYATSSASTLTSVAVNARPLASAGIDLAFGLGGSAATMDESTIRGAFEITANP